MAQRTLTSLCVLLMLVIADSQRAAEPSFGTLLSRARFGGRPFSHFGRRLQPLQTNPPVKVSALDGEKESPPAARSTAPSTSVAETKPTTTTNMQPLKLAFIHGASTTLATKVATISMATQAKTEQKTGVGRSDALRSVETGSFVVGGSPNYVEKTVESKPSKINIESKVPSISSQPTHAEFVRAGETAILHCTFEELPQTGAQQQVQIWWTRMSSRAQDKPLVLASGAQVRVPDERLRVVSFPDNLFSILIIRNAVEEDAAEYKCSLPTVTGYRTVFSKLEVRESLVSQIESSGLTNIVKSGDDLALFCKSKVGRPLSVWWSAKTNDGRTINLSGSEDKSWGETLLLNVVTKDMEGIYTCYVENNGGSPVKKHFAVTVKERPWHIVAYRQGLKADAQLTKMDRFVAYGDTLNLRCDSGGVPKPKVTWYKQGSILAEADNKNAITTHEPSYKQNALISKLVVTDFSSFDVGRYTCVFENEMGLREHHFEATGTTSKSSSMYQDGSW